MQGLPLLVAIIRNCRFVTDNNFSQHNTEWLWSPPDAGMPHLTLEVCPVGLSASETPLVMVLSGGFGYLSNITSNVPDIKNILYLQGSVHSSQIDTTSLRYGILLGSDVFFGGPGSLISPRMHFHFVSDIQSQKLSVSASIFDRWCGTPTADLSRQKARIIVDLDDVFGPKGFHRVFTK